MDKPDLRSPSASAHSRALPAFDDTSSTVATPMSLGPLADPDSASTVMSPLGLGSRCAGPAALAPPPAAVTGSGRPSATPATNPPGVSPFARRATVLPRITVKDDGLALVQSDQERYHPLRRLGAGAMGEVSLEHDNDIGRTVAVKRLTADLDNSDGLVRFIAEVQTIGQLEHPNIIPIHDVGLDQDGRYYFVMKYVDGETLEAIITKLAAGDPDYHARYPAEVRLEIFLGLLHALQYAHDQGVVHRDIKPANGLHLGRWPDGVPPLEGAAGDDLCMWPRLAQAVADRTGAGGAGAAAPAAARRVRRGGIPLTLPAAADQIAGAC